MNFASGFHFIVIYDMITVLVTRVRAQLLVPSSRYRIVPDTTFSSDDLSLLLASAKVFQNFTKALCHFVSEENAE